jgi:hypothetical protein
MLLKATGRFMTVLTRSAPGASFVIVESRLGAGDFAIRKIRGSDRARRSRREGKRTSRRHRSSPISSALQSQDSYWWKDGKTLEPMQSLRPPIPSRTLVAAIVRMVHITKWCSPLAVELQMRMLENGWLFVAHTIEKDYRLSRSENAPVRVPDQPPSKAARRSASAISSIVLALKNGSSGSVGQATVANG